MWSLYSFVHVHVKALILLHCIQPALDLLTTEEMRSLFYGGSGSGPPSAQLLQRWATYEAPVCADDLHVTVSTACLSTVMYCF